MLAPIIANGINLAVIATANLSGLTLAWILNINGGPHAGVLAFVVGVAAALAVGGALGAAMGVVIAYFGAHPILASLAMMIFLKGLGEFLTRGGDISGFPAFLGELGHGVFLGIPVPMLVFIAAAILWHVLLARASRLLGGDDRLQPAGERLFGNSRQTLAHSGLRPFGSDVRARGYPDADGVQFGARRARRSAAAGHRARVLPRRCRSVRRIRSRGASVRV